MMSKLDDLIKKYCPNGVEFLEIQKCSTFRRGSFPQPYTNEKFYGGKNPMPFVQVADMKDESLELAKKTKQTISELAMPKSIFVPKNSILISIQGTIGRVAITQYDCYVDRTILIFTSISEYFNKKFFAYVLKRKFLYEKNFARGSTLKTITKEELSKYKIPVPPLPVQEEIVRILDSFTKLNEELIKELINRKKQYEYYRDNLLNFKDKSIYLPLEQILKIKSGKDYKHLNIGKIPVYGTGGIITYVDEYTYNKPSVLIPRKGSLEKLYYLDTPFWNVDTVFYTEIFNNVVEKYVFYCLQKEHLEKLNTAGGVPSLTKRVLNKVRIPIPSLDKQKYIVSILDKFNTLCNDLSIGLPAEIEARKKQYEYYRDKILTFKELKQ